MQQPRSSNVYQLVESLYQRALDVPADSRMAFLARECADDRALFMEVRTLLRHFDCADRTFLGQPAHNLAASVPEVRTLPDRIGRYRVIRLIGEGGMGIVYEAEQDQPRRRVALKLIRPGVPSKESVRRFHHEAEVLGQLDHPGIARIFDAGTTLITSSSIGPSEQPYMAMELVRGVSLLHYTQAAGSSVAERLELVAQVCDAVQYAHRMGVIHRDLKPANILVDESGRPMILDFGVARLASVSADTLTMHTHAGQLVGTLPYMSVEQLTGRSSAIDTRSDVYSLGVMAYELLCNRPPFNVVGMPLAEAIRTICDTDAVRVGVHDRRLCGDVEAIIARAMEKSPARRYGSASELADDLRRYIRHEPIRARPPTIGYQCARFARRHRGLVGGLVAALVALVAGAIGTATYAWQARNEAARAAAQSARAQAVTTFLRDMLTAVDPRKSASREPTVRDVLDAAADRLDRGELANQAQVESALRSALGETYLHLGRYAEAKPQLERALELLIVEYGKDHAAVMSAQLLMASTLVGLGQSERAVAMNRDALDTAIRLYGTEHRQVAAVLGELGTSASDANDDKLAEDAYRRALMQLRTLPDVPPLELATGLHNLGAFLLTRRKDDEADRLLQEAASMRRSHMSMENPALANTLSALAGVMRRQEKPAAAEALFREVLANRRRALDSRHPDIASTLNNLAGVLMDQLRFAEAVDQYREAIAIQDDPANVGQPELGKTLLNLCAALAYLDRCPEALDAGTRAVEVMERIHGGPHVNVALAMHNLAMSQLHCGDLHGAVDRLEQGLSILAERLPPDHLHVAHFQNSLGCTLVLLNRHAEALPVLEASLATRVARLDTDDYLIGLTSANTCEPRWRQGNRDGAIEAAQTAIRILQKHPGSGKDRAVALVCLAEIMLDSKPSDETLVEARNMLIVAHEIWSNKFGPDSRQVNRVVTLLSRTVECNPPVAPESYIATAPP